MSIPKTNKPNRDFNTLFRRTSVPSGSPTDYPGKQSIDINDEILNFLLNFEYVTRFIQLNPKAKEPQYGRDGDACRDIFACLDAPITIYPQERRTIPTGVGIALYPSFELQVRPRSGNAGKLGLTVLNTPGCIDSNYRGEIGVILFNTSDQKVEIKHHAAIAQVKVAWAPKMKSRWITLEEAGETNRGSDGFGSSGLVG